VKRAGFIAAREARWARLEELVERLDAAHSRPGRRRDAGVEDAAALAPLYRRTCQDLALAKHRMYGRALIERLNAVALAARVHVYRDSTKLFARTATFFGRDFPRYVRAESRFFWISALVYLAPLIAVMLIARDRPDLLFAAADPELVQNFEEMYDPARPGGLGRTAEEAVAMFGFYVQNNVGGDIRAFAGGALWGVGTLLLLFYNGLVHGAVFGHVSAIGFGDMLWPFVSGHAAVELTAFFISSAAGLRVGAALIAPGRRTRTRALREDSARTLGMFGGAVAMTVAAAFVEGFWSASAAPPALKYAVGALLTAATVLYFLLAGRGAPHTTDAARTPRS
jgi:uncharacterized membrane protein SpoIIM required for sporulation